jgi:hypothetical protein
MVEGKELALKNLLFYFKMKLSSMIHGHELHLNETIINDPCVEVYK